MAISSPKSIPRVLSSPDDDHHHRQERLESDGPTLTTRLFLPCLNHQENDLDKTIRLSKNDVHAEVDLSKFRKEVPSTFLCLGLKVHHDLAVVLFNQNSKRKSAILIEEEPEKKKIRRDINPLQAPSDLSPEFLQKIEAERPVFLYRKCLSPTDVHRSQNRLLVTNAENVRQFLTRDEEHEIVSGHNNYIQVIGIDCMERKFDLRLSTWGDRDRDRSGEASTSNNTNSTTEIKKKKKMSIVFNKQWCDMLEANGVKSDDIAELWGFRKEAKFCLIANFIRH